MEARKRDSQKSKCYAWEATLGLEEDSVPFERIQSVVDFVWNAEGLQHPPRVKKLPKQATTKAGTGSRLRVSFHDSASTVTILHEIAHAMTSDIDGNGDKHGPHFIGTLMLLYAKYLKIPMGVMTKSARGMKLKYHFGTQSVF